MRGQNEHLDLAATVGTSSELLPRVETLEGAFLRRLLGLFDIMIGSSDQQSLLHPLPDLANLTPRIVRLGFHLLRAAGPTPPLQSSIMIRLLWISLRDLMACERRIQVKHDSSGAPTEMEGRSHQLAAPARPGPPGTVTVTVSPAVLVIA